MVLEPDPHLILPVSAPHALGVAHVGEGDGVVQRHPHIREHSEQGVVQFLAKQEGRPVHQVAHLGGGGKAFLLPSIVLFYIYVYTDLDVVVHGEVADGLGVGVAMLREPREDVGEPARGRREPVKQPGQQTDVLEALRAGWDGRAHGARTNEG